jgi:hypothetical protein
MAFSWLPLIGNTLDAAFGLGSTKAQVGGATQAASQIEKYNREALGYLGDRVNQGRNDLLQQGALGRQFLEPYINSGNASVDTLTGEVLNGNLNRPFSLNDLQLDPGYQFRLGEGQKGITNNRAAGGMLQSGGTLKALDRYNQNFASSEFQNAYNRFTDAQNRRASQLFGLSGQGLTAAGEGNQSYQNAGSQLLGQALPAAGLGGSYLQTIGDAQAAARAQRGSAYGDFYNQLGSDAQGLLQTYWPRPKTQTFGY